MIETRRYWIDSSAKARRVAAEIERLRVDSRFAAEVIIRPARREKTTDQRGLFHAICTDIALEMGETPKRVKAAIKEDYYGVDIVKIGDRHYRIVQSSEDEDRAGYSRLIDFAYIWAAEREVIVRDRRPSK